MFRITFNTKFTRQKWVAVFLLLIGCITSQADKLNHADQNHVTVPPMLCSDSVAKTAIARPSFCPAVPPAPAPQFHVTSQTAECLRSFACEAIENSTSHAHATNSSSGAGGKGKHGVISIVDDPSVHHKVCNKQTPTHCTKLRFAWCARI